MIRGIYGVVYSTIIMGMFRYIIIIIYEVPTMFQLPENNKHPNFEWRRQGRGADSFVLLSYPI